MGNLLNRKQRTKVICIGLDNSGKSTIINTLKPSKCKKLELNPTIGFQSEEFTYNNIIFQVFDMSGQSKYRNLWEYYYDEIDGIIFVVDSTDSVRLCVVKDELEHLLSHQKLLENKKQKNKILPILFCCNKKDLPDAQTTKSIEVALSLKKTLMRNNPFHMVSTNGLTGDGLQQGLNWLSAQMEKG
eukprot:9264_1